MKSSIVFLLATISAFAENACQQDSYEVVAQWKKIEYENLPDNVDYLVKNNILTGVKVWKGEIFVTVSRWLPGVPSALNKVVKSQNETFLMQPFPSWELQEIGNCQALQFVQSMEIDPKSGWMWVIDAGRKNVFSTSPMNDCPPKLVIIDLASQSIIHRHIFPNDVLGYETNFVNDIVIDPINGDWAYMSDVGTGPLTGNPGGIIVYDFKKDSSWRLEHESMTQEPGGSTMVINGEEFIFDTPVDGIGLTPDGSYLFYCPLSGFLLYRLPTEIAQIKDEAPNIGKHISLVGEKISQSDGMLFGHRGLYYGAMQSNSIYKWDYVKDMADQGSTLGEVTMTTQTLLAQNDKDLIWPDTFAMDEEGYLYFTTNKLPFILNDKLDWEQDESHFRVIRVFVNDKGYLAP